MRLAMWRCVRDLHSYPRCSSALNKGRFYSGLSQRMEVRLADVSVGNHGVDSGQRHDVTQAAPSKLARIADGNGLVGNLDHDPIDLGLKDVWCEKASLGIESVYSEKEDVGTQPPESLLGNRANQGKRI